MTLLLLTAPSPTQQTKQPAWDLGGLIVLDNRFHALPLPDQQGIAQATGERTDNLLIARIRSPRGHLFLLQTTRPPEVCGAAGNCPSWVLDDSYRVLLRATAQTFRVQAGNNGQVDIVTYVHGSATSGGLTRWRFDGHTYRRAGCASLTYTAMAPKTPPQPHIAPVPCH